MGKNGTLSRQVLKLSIERYRDEVLDWEIVASDARREEDDARRRRQQAEAEQQRAAEVLARLIDLHETALGIESQFGPEVADIFMNRMRAPACGFAGPVEIDRPVNDQPF
jgi:hypothetical protein